MKSLLLNSLLYTASVFSPLFVSPSLSQNAASQQTAKETRHLGFHGIAVGQPVSTLPFLCNDSGGSCEGSVDDNIVFVNTRNSKVEKIEVGYVGPLRIADKLLEPPPITLAQAFKLHSLQAGGRPSVLEYQEWNPGKYWLVDMANQIEYWTDIDPKLALSPQGIGNNRVTEVDYLPSGDVRLIKSCAAYGAEVGKCNTFSKPLGTTEAESLLAAAKRSALYVPAAPSRVPQLSSYMRDVGLLYIETVERGVDVMVDRDIPFELRRKQSQEQFKLLRGLEDRIEIHTETQADKDFYEYGLKRLSTLGEADAASTDLSFALIDLARITGKLTDQQKAESAVRAAKKTIEPYLRCKDYLRPRIKDGEYDLAKLLRDYCN